MQEYDGGGGGGGLEVVFWCVGLGWRGLVNMGVLAWVS